MGTVIPPNAKELSAAARPGRLRDCLGYGCCACQYGDGHWVQGCALPGFPTGDPWPASFFEFLLVAASLLLRSSGGLSGRGISALLCVWETQRSRQPCAIRREVAGQIIAPASFPPVQAAPIRVASMTPAELPVFATGRSMRRKGISIPRIDRSISAKERSISDTERRIILVQRSVVGMNGPSIGRIIPSSP